MTHAMIPCIFLMIGLTFLIFPITLFARVKAVREQKMRIKDFKLMDFTTAPSMVIQSTRHFSNLFEVPILFYVLSLLAIFQNIESSLLINCGYLFVFFRAIHMFIHITYNNVNHRLIAFILSNFTLMIIFYINVSHFLGIKQ